MRLYLPRNKNACLTSGDELGEGYDMKICLSFFYRHFNRTELCNYYAKVDLWTFLMLVMEV